MFEYRASPLGDVAQHRVEPVTAGDSSAVPKRRDQPPGRRTPGSAGVRKDPQRVEIGAGVGGDVQYRILVADPGWAEVPPHALPEAIIRCSRTPGGATRLRWRSTAIWIVDSSRALRPGPSPARTAESWLSAAGQENSTPAQARWCQVSGPVWLTYTPGWTSAQCRRRRFLLMSVDVSPSPMTCRREIRRLIDQECFERRHDQIVDDGTPSGQRQVDGLWKAVSRLIGSTWLNRSTALREPITNLYRSYRCEHGLQRVRRGAPPDPRCWRAPLYSWAATSTRPRISCRPGARRRCGRGAGCRGRTGRMPTSTGSLSTYSTTAAPAGGVACRPLICPTPIHDVDPETGFAVRRALAAMSPEHREGPVLRYYADLSERDTADVLKVPPGPSSPVPREPSRPSPRTRTS